MLRINLCKSLPINSTLCKRLVQCRRDHKVKFLVIALELHQPHVCLPVMYLRIAFSVWYFSGRTCFFSALLFLVLLTYTLGLLACSVIRAYSSYLTEKTNTIQQIKFVHLFICLSFAGTDPADSGAELAKLHCLPGKTSSLLSHSAGALPISQARAEVCNQQQLLPCMPSYQKNIGQEQGKEKRP